MSYEFEAPVKDPQSILFHGMNWSAWLDLNESITAQQVTSSDAALQIDQVSQTAGTVSWRVQGGLAGTDYTATVRVTTSNGRVDERTVRYKVRER